MIFSYSNNDVGRKAQVKNLFSRALGHDLVCVVLFKPHKLIRNSIKLIALKI